MQSIKNKSLLLIGVVLVLVATTFSFAFFHNEDGTDAVSFLLSDQYGQKQTHKDFSDKPLLVFFGFTSCDDVCPLGLYTLSNVMNELKKTGQQADIRTVMITVDPERDTAQRMMAYLSGFDKSFIGLRGTRVALANVAAEFNTFLDKPPVQANIIHNGERNNSHSAHGNTIKQTELGVQMSHHYAVTDHPTNPESSDHTIHLKNDHGGTEFIENYQLTHSSAVYLVDTNSRVVGYISLDDDVDSIVNTIRKHLETEAHKHG